MTLPFLVVHGAIVWKLLVPALVVATMAFVRGIVASALRYQSRAIVGDRLRECGAVEPGRVILRGRLRGGTVGTLTRGGARHHVRTGAPWFEHDDGTRVELDEATHVVSGSRVRIAVLGLPRGTPATVRLRGGGWTSTTVEDGDAIVVRGDLVERHAGTGDYRSSAKQWRLTGETDLFAVAAVGRAPAPRLVTRLVIVTLLALGWIGILAGIGGHYVTVARERDATLDELGPIAIAAALPGSRDQILAYASERNVDLTGRTGRGQRLGDELDGLAGGCREVRHQLEQGRFDEAIGSARACRDRDLEVTALLATGRYEEALAVGPTQLADRELAAVATGNWRIAADTTPVPCRRAWYRTLAGDAGAFDELHPGARSEPSCVALDAASERDPEKRRALLRTMPADKRFPLVEVLEVIDGGRDWTFLLGALEWLAGYAPPSAAMAVYLARQAHARDVRMPDPVRLPVREPARSHACPGLEHAVRDARSGDATRYAHFLATCWSPFDEAWLLAIAPSLERGRSELADALRGQRLEWIGLPFHFIEHAVRARDLAHAVDDVERVAALQVLIDRHLAHFTVDRDRVIAASLLGY